MYTRDFKEADSEMKIPSSYCGNAFTEEDALHTEDGEDMFVEKKESGILSAVSRLMPGGRFDLKSLPFLKSGFGTEEILILALAAFLLFSKDGDKECAVILLLVLFLN